MVSQESIFKIEGDFGQTTVNNHSQEIKGRISSSKESEFLLDLSGVLTIDSSGVALLLVLKDFALGQNKKLVLKVNTKVQKTLDVFLMPDSINYLEKPKSEPITVTVGDKALRLFEEVYLFLVLFVDMLYWSGKVILKPSLLRKGSLSEQSIRIGSQSFGIIGLIAFLIGVTLALQASFQLAQFGAEIFLADMVGISMFSEMGPLMSAILMAGRIGSSTSSEIATMVISEEIDALETMGINPVRYVVAPKFIAITVTMPLLSLMASVIGVFGGMVVAVLYAKIGFLAFVNQLLNSLTIYFVITGLVKSFAFGWIVISVGAHVGFQASGGSEGVGRATTSAVVTSIFLVIVADAVFSFIFY